MDRHCRSITIKFGLAIVLLALVVMDAWAVNSSGQLDSAAFEQKQLQWSGPNPIPPWKGVHLPESSPPAAATREKTSPVPEPKIMPDPITLIAALIGSVATAFLSYIVQQQLAQARRREEEERLAFVFLVQISDFVAGERVVVKILEAATPLQKLLESELEKRTPKDGAFEPNHALCAIISEYMRKYLEDQGSSGYASYKNVLLGFKAASSSLDNFAIPPNLLAQIPRDAVVAYSNMVQSVQSLRGYVKAWESWGDKGGKELVSAEALFSQWNGLKTLAENARALREALIRKGKVPRTEADKLLLEQARKGWEVISTSLLVGDKLKAAEAAIRKEMQSRGEDQK